MVLTILVNDDVNFCVTELIEVEVHNLLRNFLRSQSQTLWPHHLTMARLVARALRLGRSALIQTGVSPYHAHPGYRLSYLIPVLMWSEPSVIVAPPGLLQELLQTEIPQLYEQQGLELNQDQPILQGKTWPAPDFRGLLLTTPQAWLADRLVGGQGFPEGIPTIIDGADDLETWAAQQLTVSLHPQDWTQLMEFSPQLSNLIRDTRVQLTRAIFQHPANPYHCHLLELPECQVLQDFYTHWLEYHPSFTGSEQGLNIENPDRGDTCAITPDYPSVWNQFWHQWHLPGQLRWAEVDRTQGLFWLYCSPAEVASSLQSVWLQQPVVLIGGALDLEKTAPTYRQLVGLEEITGVKFSPDRNSQLIQLYLPSGLPLPNTPQFQTALIEELRRVLCMSVSVDGITVLLIADVPLKSQVSAVLAAEFGSRVQVETTDLDHNSILVTGWEFWREHQQQVQPPHLVAIATLPLPSLEHPLVAGRVAHYKQNRQDWFRLYLLPTALRELQRAVVPVRQVQGVVALFDSRVLNRTYGEQVLAALSPLARIDYLDLTWLS